MTVAIAAAIAVLTGVAAGLGIGLATGKPEAAGDIRTALILGCALAEATAVYGLVIGILIIFIMK